MTNKPTNPDGSTRGHIAVTATVADTAHVGPNALVYGTAQVYDTARVYGTARVYDNAQVYGDALVCGNARVYGNALVCQNHWVVSGYVTGDLTDVAVSLAAQCGAIVTPGKRITLAKRVNSTDDPTRFTSCYDDTFVYTIGKTVKVEAEESQAACAAGIHVSSPTYWEAGDTLIAVSFLLEDVVTVQEGKARLRRCRVEGVIG